MPFTPFHLGIGAFAKSVTPNRWFSIQGFTLSRVLIDIQPGISMTTNWGELHG